MKEMLQKKYSFPIRFLNKKTIVIEYKQATLRELLEIGEVIKNEKTLTVWLYDFLCKNSVKNGKITLRMFEGLKSKNANAIITYLLSTHGKGYFKEMNSEKKEEIQEQTAPDSSLFVMIFEHSNETMESLLDLTWEQIEYIIDGITWNMRGKTKEGQSENRRQWARRQSEKNINKVDALKQIEMLEKRISNKRKKNE